MIIAIGGIKGGTGKTILALNLVIERVLQGRKVLFLDSGLSEMGLYFSKKRKNLGIPTNWDFRALNKNLSLKKLKLLSKNRVFFILLAFLGGSYQWLNGEESYMSASSFVLPCDPLLRNKASEVPIDLIVSDEVQSIIEKMMRIVGNYREDRGNGVMVGLAAPQIGIPLSIIIVDMHVDSSWSNLGDLVAYINPRITWSSDDIIDLLRNLEFSQILNYARGLILENDF